MSTKMLAVIDFWGGVLLILAVCAGVIAALAGCSHNTGAFTVGTRINAGLDPQNATANISYTDGLNVVDVSRENASWELDIDNETGVSVDRQNNTIKGVKRIKREVGPQITGYLVDLAGKDPDMARNYVEAVKNYWEYKKNTASGEK